jgi:hypothetical protein
MTDNESLGQLPPLPLHVSAGSHVPAEARHTVPAAFGTHALPTKSSQLPQVSVHTRLFITM